MIVFEKFTWVFICILFSHFAYSQNSKKESDSQPKPIKMPVVNHSTNIDFSPTISADGKLLIFESDRKKNKWMLYQSIKSDDGKWSTPTPINSINDKCEFVAGPNLSYDGNTLYYTAFIEGVSQTEDIYYSVQTGNGWSEPIKFTNLVNTDEGYEGFCSISSDERDLYYISINPDYPYDKKNKESCFNIWVTRRNLDGEWSKPEMVSETINSGCVRDPKIMADNRTLLFSKVNPGTKGKYDLYQSALRLDGTWGEPVSLKYVNTALNNLAPGIPASGDIMYFYSEGDIYTIEIPEEYQQFFNANITGIVSDFKTGTGIPAKIVVKDASTLETMSIMHANDKGEYSIVLGGNRSYVLEYVADDYLSHSEHFDLQELNKYYEEEKNVKLKSDSDIGVIAYDKVLNKPIPATITIFEDGIKVLTIELTDYQDSGADLSLPVNKNYKIEASSDSYLSESKMVSTHNGESLNLRFYLEPKVVQYHFLTQDENTMEFQRTNIRLKNFDRDEIIDGYSNETFQLRPGDQYEVLTYGNKGYFQTIDVFEVAQFLDHEIRKDEDYTILMTPLKIGANFTLDHIYFETASAQLSPASQQELDRLVDFLELNSNISVEISAHTDNVGSDEYNMRLSDDRAASVTGYLVSRNIDKSRLRSVGFGESQPVVPNDTAENRSKNRRVEMTITGID
ncbi:MAG: OmpA family protein [Cyclobacteriaceae bacterium]|nr:OmpA family protein [Cyclobacteriaceae bacterium]